MKRKTRRAPGISARGHSKLRQNICKINNFPSAIIIKTLLPLILNVDVLFVELLMFLFIVLLLSFLNVLFVTCYLYILIDACAALQSTEVVVNVT